MRQLHLWTFFAALLLAGSCAHLGAGSPQAEHRLVNGLWFDGQRFVPREMTVVGGRLQAGDRARGGEIVNLAGGYVVPPFCEAHNHNLPLARAEDNHARIDRFLADGIFYVQITGNLSDYRQRHAGLFNRPDSVDITFANAGLTATGGHPTIMLRDFILPMGVFPGESVESLRGRYYFIIDNVADLDREWPAILGARPDFIKAFLFHSEEYTQRRDIDVPRGYKALNPELAPEIVRRAHAAGLRVVFHAHTAEDLHVALEAGADQIAHVPGLADPQPLREDDLALAARRRTPMHTTISAISRVPTADENAARRRRELIVETLGLAQRLGVNLVVGSDAEGATSRIEVAELRRLGIFSNVELLAMWGERCAQAVFPQRKVGRLAEDYEASFLVLQGDPLADFDNTGRISRAMKDGHWLKPSTTPLR